jgi:uncharacterized protein (TIGR02145 family)
MAHIPLLPVAEEILNRYKSEPFCLKKGVLLPVLSNQKMNAYLKKVADLCGITKNLTTHCTSHTFATTVTLANHISMESVSKMPGHSSLEMTKKYARIPDTTIGAEMNRLAANLEYHINYDVKDHNPIIFNPNLSYDTVTDIDGNVYKTIQIGDQVWMAEILKTTKFKDNTPIPLVEDNVAWRNLITPGYCWNNNDKETYKDIYGALYNWNTVNTGKLCPIGWHVPSVAEVDTLATYLGGYDVAGGKMKETGTNHWKAPNTGATNSSGFTGLPGSFRNTSGYFYPNGEQCDSWTSYIPSYPYNPVYLILIYDTAISTRYNILGPASGLSVRCVKDLPGK